MDSVNSSGSMQSSSGGGGEESYDSRADSSMSAFFNNQPPSTHVGSFSTNPFPPQHRHNNMFDPLSNYFDPLLQKTTTTTPPPFPNQSYLDVMWSKPTRSEPEPTDLGGLNQQMNQLQGETNSAAAAFVATTHMNTLLSSESGNKNIDQGNNSNSTSTNVVRNPKKRSRASRRAPTTVLTTDTTNFRAMVQEFTGIPAPPFSSSPFPTTRFDLFAASTIRSRSPRLDPPLPNYLIRPFPRQFHGPFPSSSIFPSTSMVDSLLASSNNPTTNSTSVNPTTFFGFQTVSQPPQNYSLGNSSLEIPPSTGDSIHKMGVYGELGLRHGRVNDDVLSPSVGVGALSSGNNNNNLSNAIASTEWGQRTSGTITNNDCDHGGGALTGTVNYSDVANGKVHYSAASSSDFHGEKGPECSTVATRRSQGMVGSWIN